LERDGRSASQTILDADLVGGVVIGRSEKCHAEALRRITDNNTSRVHLLLLREGDDRAEQPPQVYAYDLASTQGTYAHGAPVRRVPLADSGTSLMLGRGDKAVRLSWQRA
jgi:hypothetical protein